MEETIAETVKLRTQKADDKDLTDTPSPECDENYDDSDEFIDIPDISPLEGDEEVKEGKGLTILTPSKLLTRSLTLLAQIKSGNNSHKLKMKSDKILYFLYQHNKITKKVYNNLIKSL